VSQAPGATRAWVETLRASHDHLTKLVADLDAGDLADRSYDADWTIAQVLSHLGSQAEIFGLFLDAGLAGSDVPGVEAFQPVWDAWNDRGPVEQRDDSLASNEVLVSRVEALTPAQVESFRITLFGAEVDLAGYVRMRLSEHAVHTWDVEVALEPDATVAVEAVDLLVDGLGQTAGYSGKPSGQPFLVRVSTTDPARELLVSVGGVPAVSGSDAVDGSDAEGGSQGSVSLAPAVASDSADGAITLPAEAFLRLVYGRLDPEHTPAVSESGSRGLADLRAVFRGL
jgi:uncharacterized protein (TIGR03083 family)